MNDDVMPTSKHSDTVYRDDNNVQQIVSKSQKVKCQTDGEYDFTECWRRNTTVLSAVVNSNRCWRAIIDMRTSIIFSVSLNPSWNSIVTS